MDRTCSHLHIDSEIHEGLHFTVHNYTLSPSNSRIGTSQDELLALAHKLIKSAALRSDGWSNTKKLTLPNFGSSNSYCYNHLPPSIKTSVTGCDVDDFMLKEWGSTMQDDEIWRIEELDDFVSTNLAGLLNPKLEGIRNSETRDGSHKRSHVELQDVAVSKEQDDGSSSPLTPSAGSLSSGWDANISDVGPPAKKRKLDHGPLHDVIPQPHIYPSRIIASAYIKPPSNLKEYKRTIPIILPPYTNSLPAPSKYDRRAWLIPVRGTMPWERSTSANVLNPSESTPIPPAPRSLEPIHWSRHALHAFWDFLHTLQKTGRVGTLGLSFHASPEYRDRNNSTPFSFIVDNGDSSLCIGAQRINVTPGSTVVTPAMSVTSARRGSGGDDSEAPELADAGTNYGVSLSSVDYVKVYHEAVLSMLVRTALDIWAYEVKDGDGNITEKVRVLKGAKLVLVDHLSRGMLIS